MPEYHLRDNNSERVRNAKFARELVDNLDNDNFIDILNELQFAYTYERAMTLFYKNLVTTESDDSDKETIEKLHNKHEGNMQVILNSELFDILRLQIDKRLGVIVDAGWASWLVQDKGDISAIRKYISELVVASSAEEIKRNNVNPNHVVRKMWGEMGLDEKLTKRYGIEGIFIQKGDLTRTFIENYKLN